MPLKKNCGREFITIQGGHRVGIAGKTVLDGNKNQKCKIHILFKSSIITSDKRVRSAILPYIIKQNHLCHTLIISPPRCGKTTLLRDLIRQVSNGSSYLKGVTVGVVENGQKSQVLFRESLQRFGNSAQIFWTAVQRQRV